MVTVPSTESKAMKKPTHPETVLFNKSYKQSVEQKSMRRAKRVAVTFPEVLISLDKEQIEYLNTLKNPSEWIRKAIDEKRRREKTLAK